MKKLLMMFAAVLCCAMTTTVITACGSDDDDDTKPDQDVAVAALMDYKFTTSQEMLQSFDLTIDYYDANGNVQTEQFTTTEWKKSVKSTKFPAKLGARLKAKLKSGVDPNSRIKVDYGYAYHGYSVNAKDQVLGIMVSGDISESSTISIGQVNAWLDEHSDGLVKYLFTFDTKGIPTDTNW